MVIHVPAAHREQKPVYINNDMSVLDHIGLDVLNMDSVHGYRNNFASLKDSHPFVRLSDNEFLRSIGATANSEKDGLLHPTAAGMLMFGNEYDIRPAISRLFSRLSR